MRRAWIATLFLLLGLMVACQTPAGENGDGTESAPNSTDTPAAAPATEPATDPSTPETATAEPAGTARELTILYTNDEHGWMEGTEPDAGAANLLGLWQTEEGYDPDGNFLLLSGGDLWTGPAISTWFAGQSMVEVMNVMGYDAAAVGNHEFDFGLDVLQDHIAASSFPLLSANLRYRADGSTPFDLGVLPYVVQEVNGIQVGLIGLTTTDTPSTTKPDNVSDFEFIPYEEALREVVPQARADGAQLLLVPAHICRDELTRLARDVADLGIHMMGGGHCNELFTDMVGDILLMEGGASLATYARAEISYNPATDEMTVLDAGVRFNSGGAAAAEVSAVVARWQAMAEAELDVVIGYSEAGVARRSQAMQDLIVASWLEAYPAADIALTNFGGMRADIPPGEITVGTIVGVMPFDNVIVEVLLTGAELEDVLAGRQDNTAAGGIYFAGGRWLLTATDAPPDPDALYSVLVNDFMYTGGDGYRFQAFDPEGYDTSIHWRQPVIDWIMRQGSDAAQPLDAAIAALGE
ncbi:MAG: bifunctional metallophosphatase/5'-nucleotidase [Anaerolineales bacterium]|nr:bifunctional metallophosphatase/5'-nucleotidase [Anaerolineales bacterium]